jgi:uncharacterized protein HemX
VTEQSGSGDDLAHPQTPAAPEESEPLARMMSGSASAPGLALLAVAVIVILGFVLYGLNGPERNLATAPSANAPAAAVNSGTAAPTAPRNGPHAPG